jgi:hypothetical protein
MPDDNPGPRPIPHFFLYAASVALLLAACLLQGMALVEPDWSNAQGPVTILGATGVMLIAATTLGRRQEMQTRKIIAAVQENTRALATVAYDIRRQLGYTEQQAGLSYDLVVAVEETSKRVEDIGRHVDEEASAAITDRLDKLRDEVEQMIAAALVDGLRAQESGAVNAGVVPFTRRN